MFSATTISDLLFSSPWETPETADAEVLLRCGISRHSQGDLHGALDDFRAAVDADPNHSKAWNNCGVVRQALGDLPGAVADFDRALALDPHYADALNNRGRARQQLGDFTGAREDFDRGLECATGRFTATLLHNRAALRQAAGDLAGALADFEPAVEVVPDQAASLVCRATARKEFGDLAGALADLDRALEVTAPAEAASVYHQRGGVRVLLNDFVGAIADYDLALALNPDSYLLYLSRGHARYHRRDFQGIADYRTAFRLNPERAAYELVRLLQEEAARTPEEVLDNCDRHVRINDQDVVAHIRRALTLLLLGRQAEATVALDRSRELLAGATEPLERLVKVVRELSSVCRDRSG
jgi:tetratricopeptide (TPR) repeat protein